MWKLKILVFILFYEINFIFFISSSILAFSKRTCFSSISRSSIRFVFSNLTNSCCFWISKISNFFCVITSSLTCFWYFFLIIDSIKQLIDFFFVLLLISICSEEDGTSGTKSSCSSLVTPPSSLGFSCVLVTVINKFICQVFSKEIW